MSEATSSKPFPFPTADKHDPLPQTTKPVTQEPTEDALDQGIEESFPASDPVSVTVSKVVETHHDKTDGDKGEAK